MAHTRPRTVTNTVVMVPLSNMARPTPFSMVLREAPTLWEMAETSRDTPIRKIQSAAVAFFFSLATSAAAASATAWSLEVSAWTELFHLSACFTIRSKRAIHTE